MNDDLIKVNFSGGRILDHGMASEGMGAEFDKLLLSAFSP